MNSRLSDGVAEQVAAMGCELVDLRLLRQGRAVTLQIFIDKEDGVTIDDCAAVSRQLGVWLDVENPIQGAYRLEVSSPGLDRPLLRLADYSRFLHAEVDLELHASRDGRRRWKGRIAGVGEDCVTLETDGGTLTFALAEIHRAKLVPQW